jgi:hypothetical protein
MLSDFEFYYSHFERPWPGQILASSSDPSVQSISPLHFSCPSIQAPYAHLNA